MKKSIFLILFFLSTLVASGSEYKLKAAYIYHIMQFSSWPEKTFKTADVPLKIAIYGENSFNGYFDAFVKKSYRDRKISVKRISTIEEAKSSQILFISHTESDKIPKILNILKDRPILTISDTDEFVNKGGILWLKTVNNRIKIVINVLHAKSIGINFSAKLLEIAKLVEIDVKQ